MQQKEPVNELAPEQRLRELALFAGAGGGILGGKLLGWRTVCAVEINRFARDILAARQNDGCLEPFPIWDDVRTFDGRAWRGIVDVISGGFPCQDISCVGNGAGIDGKRSGLWHEFARIICEVRPRFVFVENSPVLTSRGLGRVLGDLAALGYDARWGVLGATHVGAPHKRERIWIVANSHCLGLQTQTCFPKVERERPRLSSMATGWWKNQPQFPTHFLKSDLCRIPDGMASVVDRLRCIGNGQVPAVAATAWRILTQ